MPPRSATITSLLSLLPLAAGVSAAPASADGKPTRPNVIVLLTDDLGYGDLGCQGAKPEHLRTPNIDRLAAEGIRFTDGHAASSVCTPSRWSLLTGTYAFRSTTGGNMILPGDAPLTIAPGSLTLPALFKKNGYATAVVGKWHLGLGRPIPGKRLTHDVNWNARIAPGPEAIGFDDSFIIPATGDRVPTVFVRNGMVDKLDPSDPITVSYRHRIGREPTGKTHPELANILLGKPGEGHLDAITRGVSRIGFMTGGTAALWSDRDLSDTILTESLKWIEKSKDQPFFLYLATHGIHEPRIPHARFVGKSGCGTYGDAILELDDLVGRLMAKLKDLQLDANTLIVFSSDNGGSTEGGDGRYDYGPRGPRRGHAINGVLRGGKGDAYEGGTRVPFIVRWPSQVPSGKTSAALLSQSDLMASFARLLGDKLPHGVASDSVDVLDALLGKSARGRSELLEHRFMGIKGAGLRQGNWKFINGQLYDLATDPGEQHNLAKQFPDRAASMAARLQQIANPPVPQL